MVAKPPGGRPGIVGDEPVPSAVTLAFCFVAALTCLATAPCREAAPPAHTRLVCFVCCCMMSLLFCSLLAIAPGEPAASFSRIGSRLPLSHTFHEHSRVARPPDSLLPSDATRPVLEPFLWCHPRKQNGHTRHLVATKVGAVVFATSERKRRVVRVRNGADCSRSSHGQRVVDAAPCWDADAHNCRSSDRAGRCCVHRLGRGRGGRREGE